MTAPDPFALGGRQDDGDDVLALLRQWIELHRAADRADDDNDGPECDRLLDQADRIEAKILAAKPSAVGLAVKVYLFLHLDFFGASNRDESAGMSPDDHFDRVVHPAGDVAMAIAILRDAVAFVPELAPLAEPVFAAAAGKVPEGVIEGLRALHSGDADIWSG